MAFWKIDYKQVVLNELSPFFKKKKIWAENMGYAKKQERKQYRWLKRHCEQDMSDIKLVTIGYSKHIYEIAWIA